MNFFENKQKNKLFKKPPPPPHPTQKREEERKPEPLKRGRPNNKSLKYTKKQIDNRSIKSKNMVEWVVVIEEWGCMNYEPEQNNLWRPAA